MSQPQSRCPLPSEDDRYVAYHDTEWGLPATSDQAFYEKVCLETFQAGLSWSTVLYRRQALRRAFAGFEIERVAAFSAVDVARLMSDTSIIRNRRKIEAAINNARRAIELQTEVGSLAAFFWSFEPSEQERPSAVTPAWLAANPTSHSSSRLAKALKSRGWQFVGPTGMYALMQALGIVNDHIESCPSRARVEQARRDLRRPQPALARKNRAS